MSQVYARELIQSIKSFKFGIAEENFIEEKFEIVIDDIEFKVEFFMRMNWWSFEINHTWLQEYSNDCEEETLVFIRKNRDDDKELFPEFKTGNELNELTEELVAKFLDRITAFLEELKLDKKSGHLMQKSFIRKIIARRCCFGKFMKVEDSDKCSVCLDEGIETKTPCGHTLCIPCWSKLYAKPLCPICRGNISYRVKL